MRRVRITVSPANTGKGARTFKSVAEAKKFAASSRAEGKRGKLKIKITN